MTQEGAESRGVAISDLLEGQLVIYRILNDHDISLLQNTPHTGPVTVQQVLRGESRWGTKSVKKMHFCSREFIIRTSSQNNMFKFRELAYAQILKTLTSCSNLKDRRSHLLNPSNPLILLFLFLHPQYLNQLISHLHIHSTAATAHITVHKPIHNFLMYIFKSKIYIF